MANLQSIREQISVVNNIKKITKAMELVATSKLRRLQDHLIQVHSYSELVAEIFNKIKNGLTLQEQSQFFAKNPSDSILYIIFTSDLGLAGSYNSDIFKLISSQIRDQDKLIIFGKKGISHFNDRKSQIVHEETELPDRINYEFISKANDLALSMFMEGQVRAINVVYTHFVNVVTSEKVNLQILPEIKVVNQTEDIQENASSAKKIDAIKHASKIINSTSVEFEPDLETIYKSSLPLFTGSLLYWHLAESKVAEFANRRMAMENANKNGEELLTNLKIEFNRKRQAKITQEIAEIVGGNLE